MTSILFTSDTHRPVPHRKLPKADVLVHAGDLTMMGTEDELHDCLAALVVDGLHKRVILVPGNHDWMFQRDPEKALKIAAKYGVEVLIDDSVCVNDTLIYGSPWQPWFHNWAFNAPQDCFAGADFLQGKWDRIPCNTDVLVTHGPPRHRRDMTPRGDEVGCPRLALTVHLNKPKIHVFGHIHCGYGIEPTMDTLFINASMCNERYEQVNPPILVHL